MIRFKEPDCVDTAGFFSCILRGEDRGAAAAAEKILEIDGFCLQK